MEGFLYLSAATGWYIHGYLFRKVQHCNGVEIYAMEPGKGNEVGLVPKMPGKK
jgi:hypothetical protein